MTRTHLFSAAILSACTIVPHIASAQAPPTDAKPHAFDVISIKPAQPGENWHFGFAKTGYSSAGVPVRTLIVQAYFPRNWNGKILAAPDWVGKDGLSEIEAKLDPADIDEWQKEVTQLSQPLAQQLLQELLADRFKLVAHRVPSEAEGYALVVDKRGPKLTEAAPDEPRPDHGIPLQGGGYIVPYQRGEDPHVAFYGVTMAAFAQHLVGMGAGQAVDRTGLTGKYDFTLTWLSSGPDEQHVGAISFDDPDKLSHWNFGALGLRAEKIKLPTEDLVIDHIERPAAN